MRRKLHGLKLIALMIDGVRFADHVVPAAIGIDLGGKKHVLCLREGATRKNDLTLRFFTTLTSFGTRDERNAPGTSDRVLFPSRQGN